MKILITTDWYAPTINGVVTSILHLRKELLAHGHDVRVLTLSQSTRSFESGGVTYVGSIGAGKLYPGARIKTAFFSRGVQDIVRWKPDLIHSQCEFSTFLIARRIARKLNIPIVHTYHTVYEDYTHYFSPSKKWGRFMVVLLSRWISKRTARIIVPTEKVRALLKGYGINKGIHVIPSGIDPRKFSAALTEEKRSAMKRQLGIPQENIVLLYVGRLAKEKNLEELLRYHAKHRVDNLTLLIVGDGPHRTALEEMASELGIGDFVKFAGMIAPQHIGEYYHLGDLFVSASVSETQGITYIEALTAGLPVLCRKDKCLDGVVLDNRNGWLYENEQEYFDKLHAFLNDAHLRENMSQNVAKLAQWMFSAALFAQKTEATYRDVLRKAEEMGHGTGQRRLRRNYLIR
jgi:1,2-diacylglycerol 3-alpha-glucosyltransferase